jgi:hypothetical protein
MAKIGYIRGETESTTALWNQAVHGDGEVTANRPDILILNKEDRQCMYNVTVRGVGATIDAVEKQKLLHNLCVCSFRYQVCNAPAPCCHL